jgi:large subunit ribosomal protein L19
MTNNLLQTVEKPSLKEAPGQFEVGDTVDVVVRIIEGDKERAQTFTGTVIMKKGSGINETFTVRRIVNNEGVERIFPLHSPFISKITVRRSGVNRRAKLFYLRDRVGKAVRLADKRKTKAGEHAEGAASPADRAPAKEREGELAAAAS